VEMVEDVQEMMIGTSLPMIGSDRGATPPQTSARHVSRLHGSSDPGI